MVTTIYESASKYGKGHQPDNPLGTENVCMYVDTKLYVQFPI